MDRIQQIISEQVLSWAQREAKHRQKKGRAETLPVITISREFGAGGSTLAKELSKRTGFKVWDKELLTAITEVTGADEKFLASLDERRRSLIEDTLYGAFMGFKHSNTSYFSSLLRIVHTIGAHGKSIIVGRGSNYILDAESALHLRLVCPLHKRTARVSGQMGLSEKEAEKLIHTRDAERTDFIQYNFKRNSANPEDYDLVLNSGNFNIGELADILLYAYEKKVGEKILQEV